MTMRMIPKSAGWVVFRDIVFVLKIDIGIDGNEHIIAVAGRIDPQAMRMHIGTVKAVRRIDGACTQATGIVRQFVK